MGNFRCSKCHKIRFGPRRVLHVAPSLWLITRQTWRSSIYRPPCHGFSNFINEFWDHVDTIINFNILIIICGDFNVPGQLRVIEQHLESSIKALGLIQHVQYMRFRLAVD
ncbi:hypothetical protein HELRODRAFT_169200 [Helobdella robusta]|uniref:Endonuclease/exonuclease/phosphatase domain-containing protein n=1 Tax=Helobdella robusta TaxID=6412 RepID=T1F1K4_HELRO|nr:hypothetical protein HELRODRAFT_169200 [Helobdella robusta]ESO08380.1 hypothetical protein HELRODRAFT_169200 [Helobdella robusta]